MSSGARSSTLLPRGATLFGALLFCCAWLPVTPGGRTFFRVVVDAFGGGLSQGIVMLFAAGSPFLFGLGCAVGNRLSEDSAARAVRMPVTMMHSYTVLVAWAFWREGIGTATLPLLLFAVVSSLRLISASASARASGRNAAFAWYVRTGAMFLAGVAGWLLLQRSVGLDLGIAVPVGGLCALGLLLRSSPKPPTWAEQVLANNESGDGGDDRDDEAPFETDDGESSSGGVPPVDDQGPTDDDPIH